jgi:hypothetical protein
MFFKKKKICWRLYGDHGDCKAIMLRLHGVYTATACDLWAFVLRSKRFHYVFTAFLLRSKRFHCVFKALSSNDDQNEQQTFLFFISTCIMVPKKGKAKNARQNDV